MAPELKVRKLLFSMGYRYRLHAKELPGTPDIVFRPRRKVIFVHGCFWHSHNDSSCKLSNTPASNRDYWLPKLRRNKERDAYAISDLTANGWDVLVIWECELSNLKAVEKRLQTFMQ